VRALGARIQPGLACLSAAIFTATQCQAQARPQLYFYPPPYRFSDGHSSNSPQTIDPAQITTKMPLYSGMDGVVLIVYWSSLCPEANKCNFALIDKVLQYWGQRGKKVVLSVATIGFPVKTDRGVLLATPEWVMRQIKTYKMPVRLLGAATPTLIDAQLPDFRDPAFVAHVKKLVSQLEKYDGSPTVAAIRIDTGSMGEDNPFIGRLKDPVNGFTEESWLDYTREMTEFYEATFTKSELEFDIGRLSWMWATGTARQKADVDRFVESLRKAHVLLAFNGLSSQTYNAFVKGDPKDGVARSLYYLALFHKQGGRTGLEALQLLSAKSMADSEAIVNAIKMIHPDRVDFFFDAAAQANNPNSRAARLLREVSP
jgi:hypothetical protein